MDNEETGNVSPTVLLTRFAYTDVGTFGVLQIPEFRCFTVEKPWRENVPCESCIPEATYSMTLGEFHRGGYPAYELVDVPGRSLIKIHIANTEEELLGCIALGKSLGCINGKWGVSRSRDAFTEFMNALGSKRIVPIKITHRDPPDTRVDT